MSSSLTGYRIFLASPTGLEAERHEILETIHKYNFTDAHARGVVFIPVGWEQTTRGAGRPQALINEQVRECDYYFMLLWDRLGSSPEPEGVTGPYAYAVQEEYEVARECLASAAAPMRDIVVAFKALDPLKLVDATREVAQISAFRRSLERQKDVFYDTFDSLPDLGDRVRLHLARWLHDHEIAAAKRAKTINAMDLVVPSSAGMGSDGSVGGVGIVFVDRIIDGAKRAALEGKHAGAEIMFATAIKFKAPQAYLEYGEYLSSQGRLVQSEQMYQQALDIFAQTDDDAQLAKGHAQLGIIFSKRGEVGRAEDAFRRAITLHQQAHDDEGLAVTFRNLSTVFRMRGHLATAEEYARKSLALEKKLGRSWGIDEANGFLGQLLLAQEKYTEAEKKLSAAATGYHDRNDGLNEANAIGALGQLKLATGDLQASEVHTRRAIQMFESLRSEATLDAAYLNLANIAAKRGQLKEALDALHVAMELSKRHRNQFALLAEHGVFGQVLEDMGDLVAAEKHFRESLRLSEELGALKDNARALEDLAHLRQTAGLHAEAHAFLESALGVLEKLPDRPSADKLRQYLDAHFRTKSLASSDSTEQKPS